MTDTPPRVSRIETIEAFAASRDASALVWSESQPSGAFCDARTLADVEDTRRRFERFAPALHRLFPSGDWDGRIASPLIALPGDGGPPLWVKCDHALPIAGSVKARGGIHEVLGALHHFSFWLDDWDHVRRAADILAYNAISIDIGPTGHGITRGNTIYFFDPMGTRNEVFTGGYRADPDFPVITWTEDNLGRAIFYYEGRDNGRFLTVHT